MNLFVVITEEELHRIFAEPIREMSIAQRCSEEEIRQQLKQRYDGYHFGESMVDIYNPFKCSCTWCSAGDETADLCCRHDRQGQRRLLSLTGTSIPHSAAVDGQAGQGYPCVLTAGFSAGAGSSAGSIGYGEEVAPTLKGTASGNCMPSILCLNDQGGSAMGCSEDVAGTLRAQEHGHQPLVFENHGIDARYTGTP